MDVHSEKEPRLAGNGILMIPAGEGEEEFGSVYGGYFPACLKKYPPVFTSSDASVASVDAEGVITAHKPGTALITASVTCKGKTVDRALPVAVKNN